MTIDPSTPRSSARRVWSEAWRILVSAAVGAVLLGVTITDAENAGSMADADPLIALDALIGLAALAIFPLRRRWPLAVAFALACTGAVSSFAVGAAGISVISLATHRRWRSLVLVAVPWTLAGVVYEQWVYPGADPNMLLVLGFGSMVYALCVAIGYYIGTRRELMQSLRERAETAEQQQGLRVAQARIAERHRIAREMHDVLAHRISLIAMHSGALAYRRDLTPAETAESAALIRDTSHQALEELRGVLGVLRAQHPIAAGARPELPQPTLADLDDLVSETRLAGLEVDVVSRLQTADVPDTLSRNAYRIIQEALTNARKHAAGSAVTLAVGGTRGDRLTITVRNGIPRSAAVAPDLPPSGLGLMGVTERAVLSGGSLEYGVDRRGDFVLAAWLPWPA